MSIEEESPPLKDLCAGGPGVFDEDDSDGWDEMEISGEQTTCLFCDLQFHTIAVALDHCRSKHNFDLLALKNKYNMDCYSYIKMINYIRLHKPEPKILTEASIALWDDDVYLKPGEMETWLMYVRQTPQEKVKKRIDIAEVITTEEYLQTLKERKILKTPLKEKNISVEKTDKERVTIRRNSGKSTKQNLKKIKELDSTDSDGDSVEVTSGESSSWEKENEDKMPTVVPTLDKLSRGSFVLVNFKGGKRNTTSFYYVCIIQDIDKNDLDDITVMALNCFDSNKKMFIPKDRYFQCNI